MTVESMVVELHINETGMGIVKVNGTDISRKVCKVQLTAGAGELTDVVLYMRAVKVKVIASSHVQAKTLVLDPDKLMEVA